MYDKNGVKIEVGQWAVLRGRKVMIVGMGNIAPAMYTEPGKVFSETFVWCCKPEVKDSANFCGGNYPAFYEVLLDES
jgi:hypothetical protein